MIFFVLILLILMLSTAQMAPPNSFQREYITRENTNAIKGIFTVLIFLSHGRGYIQLSGLLDEMYLAVQAHLDQMVVSMFLFYSGFGMMEQLQARGYSYVRSIPRKRFPQLLLNFDLAVLLFLMLRLVLGQGTTLKNVLLAMVGWISLGNSNWYIFVILALYICTFLSFLVLKKTNGRKEQFFGLLTLTLLSAALVLLLARAGKESWWYNTIMLFSLGMWYSFLRAPLETLLQKNDLIYYSVVAAALAAYMFFFAFRRQNLLLYTTWGICFVALTILFTMKVSIKGRFLQFLGEHLFSIFILQRLPFQLLSLTDFFQTRRYSFYLLSFAATIAIALWFDLLTGKLSKKIWRQTAVQP